MRPIDADDFIESVRSSPMGSMMIYHISQQPTIKLDKLQDACKMNLDSRPADMTENTTSRNPIERFICKECSFKVRDWEAYEYDDETDEVFTYSFRLKYCPACGRKVM